MNEEIGLVLRQNAKQIGQHHRRRHLGEDPRESEPCPFERRVLLHFLEDAREFLAIAPRAGVKTTVARYPLVEANAALADLRQGRIQGAAVLIP